MDVGDCDEVDVDEMLSVLSDRRRRAVVVVLSDRGGRMTVSELANELGPEDDVDVPDADDTGTDGEAPAPGTAEAPASERAITLHHVHLPMLNEAGVVAYDPETNIVQSTERTTKEARRLLEWTSTEL